MAGTTRMSGSSESGLRRIWKLWWPAFVGTTVFVATVIIGAVMSPTNDMDTTDWQVLIMLCVGVPTGVGGLIWSALLARWAMKRQMTEFLAEAFLQEANVLTMISCGYCPGYRPGGWPWTVGGLLGVTDQDVEFKSAPYEFSRHELRLPLGRITAAEQCRVRISPCGLRVACDDRQEYYFLFNVIGGVQQVEELARLINSIRSRFPSE